METVFLSAEASRYGHPRVCNSDLTNGKGVDGDEIAYACTRTRAMKSGR